MDGTPDQIREWVESLPDVDWYGSCAGLSYSLCRHFGQLVSSPYPSARIARLASIIVSRNPALAPGGASHFWEYVDGRGNNYGHVTADIYGGGTRTLSATHNADERWGRSVGLISVAKQTAVMGTKYIGWSHLYGVNPFNVKLTSTAESGSAIPAPTTTEVDDMAYIANVKGGNFYLVNGPKAHVLGAGSGARESGMPIISYPDDWSVAQLKAVVAGIGNH